MKGAAIVGSLFVVAAAIGLLTNARAAEQPKKPEPRCEDFTSIGTASMDKAGVITMDVRTLPPDPLGMGRIVYGPDDPRYQSVLEHLGSIRPGETVNVPPWC